MKLTCAENFTVPTADGSVFDSYQYQRHSWLLIIFYRGEWCAACRDQLAAVHDATEWFTARDVKVVAIGADSQLFTSILENTLGITFPVLADETGTVFGQFHLTIPRDHRQIKPALFLVDPEHRVRFQHVGANFADRPPTRHIQAQVRAAQRHHY